MVKTVTTEEAKELIRAAVKLATGWETILWPSQGPQPANQYCTVRLKGDEPYQYDISEENIDVDDNMLYNEIQETIMEFEIQAYGKGAMDKLKLFIAKLKHDERFYGAINDPDIEQKFKNAPLWEYMGLGGHDSVQDISTPFMGATQPRATVTVYMNALWQDKQPISEVDSFDKVDITVESRNNDDRFLLEINKNKVVGE